MEEVWSSALADHTELAKFGQVAVELGMIHNDEAVAPAWARLRLSGGYTQEMYDTAFAYAERALPSLRFEDVLWQDLTGPDADLLYIWCAPTG